jgi:hypothetical protein
MSLAHQGNASEGDDHWSRPSGMPTEGDTLLNAVRDLSLNTGGSYVGSTSNITLARILGSVVGQMNKGTQASPPETVTDEAWMSSAESFMGPPATNRPAISLMIEQGVAEKLVQTFIKCISPRFPVLHPAHVRNLFERRAELEDPYHRAILHLVFSLGGGFLVEAVCRCFRIRTYSGH